jgi:hypothetical protein
VALFLLLLLYATSSGGGLLLLSFASLMDRAKEGRESERSIFAGGLCRCDTRFQSGGMDEGGREREDERERERESRRLE